MAESTSAANGHAQPIAFDDVEHDSPISVPEASDGGEQGKLKMIIQLVKKCFGVSDIASMRLSLPASLMEPIPNLEYWHYVDRPDIFAAINDHPDPFERMLATIRFVFSKDLKFIRGRICKPYNSVLGEHFRCHWRAPALPNPPEPTFVPHSYIHIPPPSIKSESASSSIRSFTSWRSKKPASPTIPEQPHYAATVAEVDELAQRLQGMNVVNGSGEQVDTNGNGNGNGVAEGEEARVVFITEQVSHHPPISSFYYEAVDRGIQMVGVDQLHAKLSGASVRIAPGDKNKGMFISLTSGFGQGEEYQITHPIAAVNGLLTGKLYPTIGESVTVTCRGGKEGKKLRAIIEYKDEAWLGKLTRTVEGCIHTYDEWDDYLSWRKVRNVPPEKILATLRGAWNGKVEWKRADEADWRPLIDISVLSVVPKSVRPNGEQLEYESRRYWEHVTVNLLKKDFNEATRQKLAIEQKQREIAAERKRKGVTFQPAYFHPDIENGKPMLTEEGKKAITEEIERALAA